MQELGLDYGVMHCSSLAYGRHEEVLVARQAMVVLRQLLAGKEGKLLV